MRRKPATLLSAVTAALSVGIAGCSAADRPSTPPLTASPAVGPAPADAGPVPAPDALARVIDRLAFAAALRDAGYPPITVVASGLRWAPSQPADVLATVTINAANDGGEFAFPMEFRRTGEGWQLSRETAQMLLAFGNAQSH